MLTVLAVCSETYSLVWGGYRGARAGWLPIDVLVLAGCTSMCSLVWGSWDKPASQSDNFGSVHALSSDSLASRRGHRPVVPHNQVFKSRMTEEFTISFIRICTHIADTAIRNITNGHPRNFFTK
ncbi:hypothetical protein PCASD_03280 [Puccinia coronata f. sp. avenae]|uniref:Uncharacterized protein n=1 Tax=Puccinia coronata f. sp. avenae TaxID=200324 RepID=A0A2N5VDZ5_9BASI|nr:hypothetical protein PCASD_03280 [Puccinia coronata f. sp. avenae]